MGVTGGATARSFDPAARALPHSTPVIGPLQWAPGMAASLRTRGRDSAPRDFSQRLEPGAAQRVAPIVVSRNARTASAGGRVRRTRKRRQIMRVLSKFLLAAAAAGASMVLPANAAPIAAPSGLQQAIAGTADAQV